MEELKRLASEYYKNTVSMKYFGFIGNMCVLIAILLGAFSIYSYFLKSNSYAVFGSGILSMMLYAYATKQYRDSLIKFLQFYTHSSSNSINVQKSIYLQTMTAHVAPTVFDAMRVFKEIIETDRANQNFTLDNRWRFIFRFIYNSDAKNRILSLTIYLISLIALLTVIKPELDYDIYSKVSDALSMITVSNMALLVLGVLLGYIFILLPLLFAVTYIVIPLMLKMSSQSFLTKHFISELNKHSFLEIESSSTSPNRYKR